jgi:acyl transferase domain-containing protein/enoyl-CoA hydratase/carnithine racemase/NAD(P)-dependent dehydrogenase (short-subunit alcohol dehydrogenase family)/acyl carrier protein
LTGRSDLSEEKGRILGKIEGSGTKVVYLQGDISRKDRTEALISDVTSRFGRINGVIHSAGVTRDAFIFKKAAQDLDAVFGPKVMGTVNLIDALSGAAPDFVVLFSSIAGGAGNAGQCDYAYANGFMDCYTAFIGKREQATRTKYISIGWPLWADGGMGVDPHVQKYLEETLGMVPLSTANGIRGFEACLAMGEPHVILVEGYPEVALKVLNSPGGGKTEAAVRQGATAGSDGRRHEMDETQGRPAAPVHTPEVPGKGNEASASVFVDRLEDYLKDVLHRQTEIPTARIRSDEPLELYGIDSVMIMKLTRVLEKDFGELSRTLFFEYQTIGELAVYFTENHPETVGAKFGEAASGARVPAPVDFCVALESGSRGKVSNIAFEVDTGPESVLPAGSSASGGENQGIAIIGLAGRYPQAENIAEFWQNLEKGRDCIVEVPEDRWDYKPFFHPRKDGDGTIYHKWGGFLDHADKFDPLFFNISPREAELMDPQERIFLECAWHTLEDAGYARSALRGLPVGVFVGVMWGEYQIVGEEASGEGRLMGAGSVYASIANRVSYFFDFKGPSMAVDTMCSSSLTSIHLACESIIRGECSLAVAGGVNLSLHPHKYRQLSRGNFVSTDGKCRSFGEGGDGYVPGEGVGALLLKPVDRAVRDGDHIYGVILASVINHGGKTNGYTVPNPNAQTDLISAALKKSGIDPSRINCVEAHGTGTALGDPIEMTGLLNSLGKEANGIGKCAVGSVKSNIGHLEAAAGIASLTKVLMQLKHRKIVPSLHADVTNSNIRFDKIPFYTPQALSDWELPQTGDQGSASPGRRVAGISAFGAGGANAHLIVEEYVPETTRALPAAKEPFVFVLSARNKQRLWKYAERMAAFLEKKSAEHMETPTEKSVFHESICSFLVETAASMLKVDPDEIVMDVPVSEFGFEKYETTRILQAVTAEFEVELAPPSVSEFPSLNWIAERAVEERGDGKPSHGEPTVPGGGKAESKGQVEHPVARDTAYTLQVGREEMEERLAFTADSSGEAGKVLKAFLAGDGEGERWFTGRVGDEVHSIHKIIDGEEGRQFVATAIQSGKLDKIARLWVSGVRIDWELLYNRDLRPSRVSLPQYPFERERYWVVEARRKGADSRAATSRQWLHPLLGANRSTIKGFRFRTEFTGDEHYFRDHEVQGRMILPGAASVEMARKACEIVSESFVSGGKNIIWHRPVEFAGNSLLVDTIIHPRENGLDFQVVTVGKAGEENVNVTGRFLTGDPGKELNRMDLGAVAARCAEVRSPDGCYAAFKEWGIRYGSAFRGIREIRHGDDEVLVKLSIPSVAYGENQGSGLHPSLMDGAMQSIFTLLESSGDTVGGLFLPVRLGTLEIQGELPKTLSCYGRYARNRLEGGSGIRKFDLDLVDADGRIIVRVRDFTVGRYRSGTETEINRTVCRNYQTEWDASRSPVNPEARGTVMVLGDLSAGQRVSLFPPLPGRRFIHVKPAQSFAEYDTDIFGVNPSDKNDFERLFGILAQRKQVPERLIVSWSGVGDGRQADEYRREAAAGLGNGREDVEESIRPEENGTAGEEHRAGESVGEALHRRARLSLDSLYYLVQALVPMKSTHPIRMVYLGFSVDGETDPLMDAMGAFARTLNIEYPDIRFRVVEVDVVSDNERARAAKIGHRVLQELNDSEDGPVEVRYRDDKRYVRNVRHIGNEGKNAGVLISKFRVGGVYLVTGGLGGLGWIVAQYLSRTYNAKLVLTGRSAGSKRIENRLDALRKLGGEAVYARSDVSKLPDVKQVIDLARKRFGKLNGIIHSAGTILDEYILKKDCRELDRVLAPKLVGTLLLDEATRDVPIDFMVYFSSIASVFGNAGQADYAFANGFMDGYARKREALREKKCCHGKTVSINWPLWKDGGMHVDAQTIRAMEESLGITPMETAKGIAELENALKVSVSQLAVMHGYGGRMADVVESMNRGVRTAPGAALGPDGDAAQVENRDRLKTVVVAYLSELFARTSKIPLEKIKEKEPLERYGIDSVMITTMTGKIEKEFGKLSKTLFFEYRTIDELGDFFVRRHPGKIRGLEHTEDGPVRVPAVGGKDKASGTVDYAVAYQGVDDDKLKGTKSVPSNAFGDEGSIGKKSFSPGSKGGTEPSGAGQEIAIIGIAGRYPKAKNLGEFWENLKAGRDCIEPVPAARWDWNKLVVQNGKSGRKELYGWGGFLDDIDRFDPLFFNISPKDAEMIDPQERLFLECAWRTVEDAGYTRKKLESQNVGTFIGVMWGEYQMFGAEEIMKGNIIAPTASYASIANRTSYFLNLSGPSMAVDTMCSSSLAAIHLACNSIRNDECDMAIAGGVNLSLHAGKYVALGRGGFLASDGRCRTFGNGGDGYVPGEGVGAVMLKPLNRAVADGDRIHAVIKASALNHGGRTNGYTVPNPRAQADVITKALERARVPAVSIGYVEAHGTGTSLGDPIEISGLCRAYGEMDERKHPCPVGSVKSNVGHLESAAGIAGLTKLVLQMQHKTLVPSIHSEELNPNIDFEETPFLVQRKLSVWPKIHKEADPDGETWPRRAGLSAFGAGGANAHLILEEFPNEQRADDPGEDAQHLIVLSAKTDAALAKLVENLRDFIRKRHTDALTGRPVRLSEMAYTLQCGREAFKKRLGIIAEDIPDLLVRLEEAASGRPEHPAIIGGEAFKDALVVRFSAMGDREKEACLAEHCAGRMLKHLGILWVSGANVPWEKLYTNGAPAIITIPGYPFSRRKCWYNSVAGDRSNVPVTAKEKAAMKNETPHRDKHVGTTHSRFAGASYDKTILGYEKVHENIVLVTMKDRQYRNVFRDSLVDGLISVFDDITRNEAVRTVVITGHDDIFCMGGTREQLLDIAHDQYKFTDTPFLYRGFMEMDIPVISAIQGHASGGGLLFGLYADIVVMSEESIYTAPFMKYGFTPGMGATYILEEKLGRYLAREMMFTARAYRGGELRDRGAKVVFVQRADVLKRAMTMARALAEKPRRALATLKKEFAKRSLETLERVIEVEAQMHLATFKEPEVQERIKYYYPGRNNGRGQTLNKRAHHSVKSNSGRSSDIKEIAVKKGSERKLVMLPSGKRKTGGSMPFRINLPSLESFK